MSLGLVELWASRREERKWPWPSVFIVVTRESGAKHFHAPTLTPIPRQRPRFTSQVHIQIASTLGQCTIYMDVSRLLYHTVCGVRLSELTSCRHPANPCSSERSRGTRHSALCGDQVQTDRPSDTDKIAMSVCGAEIWLLRLRGDVLFIFSAPHAVSSGD